MKKILITGATGFVGRHFIEYLKAQGRRGKNAAAAGVKIFGTCFPEHPESCAELCAEAPFVTLVRLDLRKAEATEQLISEIKPDEVFHLAAISQVSVSWEKRRETFEANLVGTFNLFEALRRHAPRARLLFVSSSDVYGNLKPGKKVYREEDRGGVVSPYALTKAGGELVSRFYAAAEKMRVVVARSFPHTGPGQTADFVFSDWASQIAKFEQESLAQNARRTFTLKVGNLAIRRDYSDVRDVVRAYVLLLTKGRPGEVYNVCSGHAPALGEALAKLVSLSTAKIRIAVDPARIRRADIPYLAGSNAKIRRDTGWAPRIPFDQTLQDLLEYWRAKVREMPAEKAGIPEKRSGKPTVWKNSRPEMTPGRPHVLVTGGAGYIGSLLVGELLRRGHRVTVLDKLLFGGGSLLAFLNHPGFVFRKADVSDRAAIAPFFEGVAAVVHLAAIVGYPSCAKAGPEASFASNLDGTRNVFELAEAAGARRFVFASTYSNYGIAAGGKPVTEDSPLFPQSIYAETKIAAERYLVERAARSRCLPVIYRFATLFGPSPRTRFDLIINQFVWEALSTGRLMVYQPQFNRSFVHIRDIIGAILLALEASEAKLRGQIFNVGSNAGNFTKEAIVRLIQKYAPEVTVEYKDLKFDGDMRDVAVSFDKIEGKLGWRAKITVEEGIKELVEAVRSGLLVKIANGSIISVNAAGD
jgi:nucleoside-diphosphate-sugar epimerase